VNQEQWQEMFLKGVSWEDLCTRQRSGVNRSPVYPIQKKSAGDFFCGPTKDEVFLSIHCPKDEIWDASWSEFPGAAMEVALPETETSVLSKVKDLFVRGSFWRNQETLEPWLKKLPDSTKNLFLCWDPWSLGLHHGRMSRWGHNEFPIQILDSLKDRNVCAFRFSSELYHLAGGNESEEIGILLSTVAESLRFFEGRLETLRLLKHMSFEIPLGYDPLLSAAKIQSFYHCWGQLLEAFPLPFHRVPAFGVASLSGFSKREPWTNLMRITGALTGSFMGGASGFRHRAFDHFSKKSFSNGRLSRNLELILQLESEIGRVKNPLQGSAAFHDLVSQISQKAWFFFQDIERKGGLVEALQSGWLQKQLQNSRRQRNEEIFSGQRELVGITAYSQKTLMKDPIGILGKKDQISLAQWWEEDNKIQSIGKEFKVEPVPMELESEIFEKWLLKSDEFFHQHGRRPSIVAFAPHLGKVRERLQQVSKKVAPSGFELIPTSSLEGLNADCIVCLGLDPTDIVWGERQELFKELGYNHVFWYGEKKHELFNTSWGPSTGRDEVCKDLYRTLAGGNQ